MPERFARRILDHIADRRYQPQTVRDLAKTLSIPKDDYEQFRDAVNELLQDDQVVLGSSDTLALPPPGKEMEGVFRKHERGFGFLVPDELTEHGDLFIPPNATADALTGDRVRAKVIREPARAKGGRSPYTGRIIEVLQRADRQYVGTLYKDGPRYLVDADGRKALHDPVIIRDPGAKNAKPGDKVVFELIEYPGEKGKLAEGVITEVLGESGEPDVETVGVMRAFGLKEKFPEEVVTEAREVSRRFEDGAVPPDREDLTGVLTATIDPPDAKDFDDAISIRRLEGEGEAVYELGVHIADVAHFVTAGSELDTEAYERGNSTYLPRRVIPMLPELLSNGVCSLQEGVNRYTKSAFIRYDAKGRVVAQRLARTVIRSDKRLTYLEAQALIDGDLREAVKHAKTEAKYPKPLLEALSLMDELAKVIRKRRMKQGMIVLGLPEVQLVFDDAGRVVDAEPTDDAFTHTIIEMFMVEANEAAAELFDQLDLPMIRRVHPDPDAHDVSELRQFARVAGYNIPARPSRKELQTLLEAVRGKPAQQSVHMAVLRTLSKAEYSPMLVGHFALASKHYTHFTSPIRRYPDLVVHRGLDAYLERVNNEDRGKGKRTRKNAAAVARDDRVPDEDRLREIGRHCSDTERNSQAAERELRSYLVLELLSERIGEDFAGTVTGVASSGAFVQLDRYLCDGFVHTSELPGSANERWQLNSQTGALVAQRSGRVVAIGTTFIVRIAKVDLVKRQMELVVVEESGGASKGKRKPQDKAADGQPRRRKSRGAKAAQQKAERLKSVKNKDVKRTSESKPSGAKAGDAPAAKSKRSRRRRR